MKQIYIGLLLIFLSLSPLQAQDQVRIDSINTLSEVVLTYQADQTTPFTYQNIDSKTLEAKSIGQEPSFLLAETPSITNYSDAGNAQGYSYFRLRGIDQTRINITLDGVPLNEPEDQGAYFSNYPDLLNSVSRLQIQRGVGTSKNGVASYAGSVQLFSPQLYRPAQTTFGIGYGSFNSFRAFGEYNSGVKDNKALYVRASHIQADGYKQHASNVSQSLFMKGGLFYDRSSWKFNLLVGQQRNEMAWIGVTDSLINIDRTINANSDQEEDQFLQCLAQLQNTWQINASSSLQSSLYYTFLKGNYDFDLNNFLGFPSTEELYNYAFLSHFIGFFSNYTFSKKALNWTTGFHGNLYNRRHTGSERTLEQLYQNTGHKNEFSLFSKADYTLGQWTLFADLQYRYSSFDYEGSVALDQLEWNFLNPKAGLSWSLHPNSILYYSIGRTGREPTRNDLFGGNDDLLADSLGNALLFNSQAESVWNHELGFRHQQKRWNLNLNLYYMDFKNEIVLDGKFGPNGLVLTNNVEQSFRTGIECSIGYRLDNGLALTNHSSLNYSRIKEQSEKFSPILTPPLIINQEVSYAQNNFTVALSARYQDQSYIDFANTSSVDAYFLLNARAAYQIQRFNISLFLNNITNARYFNNGYIDFDGSEKYFVQSPFHFYTAIQYTL